MINRRSILALAAVLLATGPAGAESLDGILNKIYDARGGLDNIKSVETARMSGKFEMVGMMEAPITLEWKRPNKLRMEFVTPQGNGVQAFDGEKAWALMPGMPGPQELTGDQAASLRRQADFIDGPLVDWKDKGNSVEYLGEEDLDGVAVHKIKLTRPEDSETTIYVDTNFLAVRQNGMTQVQGGETEVDTFMSDYKKVGDLMMAYSIKNEMIDMGLTQNVTMESIEFNVEIGDDRFAMPAVAEAADDGDADDDGHAHDGDHDHGDGD